ncbi:thiamine pyrophosphate-binding protein [[Clostridium] hylemonae]|uniref:Thiamine pyrophosphate enzyme, N-terminal TPP binding domain protein n=1 Tax=[Clostridium] hylemonae DSM 15053 TaxID=553973 RepID=C0C2E1_9FIRM|nr:thiamine pyrophosphate-binding protein [[Clostridium] hylemonae]EEG73565.1 thiamine pyrophosphate enzyme, N-terminal TPP binding domain protein [[Clostridium] hylemonae DSM 15053]QEK17167.1 Acetolactate synthase isozyme 2 large subunit [[Clostridium] hylemonae DSM 15053]
MKLSDYIVEYLIRQNITDVFGYPGGMITHLMDSFRKYSERITAHNTSHEQGAAFAACGYAQTSGKPGIAYATSGPGATNLVTGICNAYFDSLPVIFITGQVNTFEAKDRLRVRQRGFQETDIVSMVSGVTKMAVYIESPDKIKYYLERAFAMAMEGRRGPVLLDIPMNVLRADIDADELIGYNKEFQGNDARRFQEELQKAVMKAKQPCFLFGNGIKSSGLEEKLKCVINTLKIPFVTSMISFDVFSDSPYYFGFIGAYGERAANFIVAKSDLLITIGARLDIRQVGAQREKFAPNAEIIRVDIDDGEFTYALHEDEKQYLLSAEQALDAAVNISCTQSFSEWLTICRTIKEQLKGYDDREPNRWIQEISRCIPRDCIITTDVGQNQIWVAQSFVVKEKQKVLFSGGHGAMGYSLPAAIGAFYGSGGKTIVSINGDGGIQMNIQELQFIAREKLPIKIVIMNNKALGMIRHFQEMYFGGEYYLTNKDGGYSAPDFCKIAEAYGIPNGKISNFDDLDHSEWIDNAGPFLLDIQLDGNTYVYPKLEFGKPNQDQEPLLDRKLYKELMNLGIVNVENA